MKLILFWFSTLPLKLKLTKLLACYEKIYSPWKHKTWAPLKKTIIWKTTQGCWWSWKYYKKKRAGIFINQRKESFEFLKTIIWKFQTNISRPKRDEIIINNQQSWDKSPRNTSKKDNDRIDNRKILHRKMSDEIKVVAKKHIKKRWWYDRQLESSLKQLECGKRLLEEWQQAKSSTEMQKKVVKKVTTAEKVTWEGKKVIGKHQNKCDG